MNNIIIDNTTVKEYNESMYSSLSDYAVEHAEEIEDKDSVIRFFEFAKQRPDISYEYAGIYPEIGKQSIIKMIDGLMKNWFEKNGMSYETFSKRGYWMSCEAPDRYGFVFKKLLHDIAEHQEII